MVRALSFWMNPFRPKTWSRILLTRLKELENDELSIRLSIASLEGQLHAIAKQREILFTALTPSRDDLSGEGL